MYTELRIFVIIALLGSGVSAHEQTPAYPKMKYSTVKDVVKFELSIFNQRERVKYYRIALFDKNFVGLPFSTRHRIIKLITKPEKTLMYILKRAIWTRRSIYAQYQRL